jgi:hypothetical protein
MKVRFTILALLFVLIVSMAMAHEGREIEGYELHFGWRTEPALTGLPNGPELFIHVHEADAAEEDEEGESEEPPFPADIEVSLQVEVTFGSESKTLDLRPAFGETGHYVADLIPSMPGDYSFRLFGTIGDTAVDEIFTSTDSQFSSVDPGSDVMFPSAGIVDVAALLARIEALEARLAELESK